MGARAAGREGGIIETGKPGGRASEIWLEEKRKAASGFLGVGAYRREDGRYGEAAGKADK